MFLALFVGAGPREGRDGVGKGQHGDESEELHDGNVMEWRVSGVGFGMAAKSLVEERVYQLESEAWRLLRLGERSREKDPFIYALFDIAVHRHGRFHSKAPQVCRPPPPLPRHTQMGQPILA